MNRNEFSARFSGGVHLLDGATGSNLIRAGMPRGVCSEKWALENPEALLKLQRDYVAAGSEILYVPSFSANRISLARHGLQAEVGTINRGLAALSLRAAEGKALVAGDLTTTGIPLDPCDDAAYKALFDAYREQAQALLEGGVELFAVETMMGVAECMAAVEAIRAVSDLPVIVTLSLQADGKCYFDGSGAEAAEAMQALGADAVGVNCSVGPDQLASVIRTMHGACTLPIAAKPNAGMPSISENGEAVYPMGAEDFARHMKTLAREGAVLLGGCCGTSPEYIAALRELKKV